VKKVTQIGLVREHLNEAANTREEEVRLAALLTEAGVDFTSGSLVTAIWRVKQERAGHTLPTYSQRLQIEWGVVQTLITLQTEWATELGVELTLTQVVERLVKLYRVQSVAKS
jgi:hypothetical protein